MHILFGKAHVSGSFASCLGDMSSNEASDEDVDDVPKPVEEKEKTVKPGKRKHKGTYNAVEEKRCRGQDTPGISRHRMLSRLGGPASQSLATTTHLSHAGPGLNTKTCGPS